MNPVFPPLPEMTPLKIAIIIILWAVMTRWGILQWIRYKDEKPLFDKNNIQIYRGRVVVNTNGQIGKITRCERKFISLVWQSRPTVWRGDCVEIETFRNEKMFQESPWVVETFAQALDRKIEEQKKICTCRIFKAVHETDCPCFDKDWRRNMLLISAINARIRARATYLRNHKRQRFGVDNLPKTP